MLPLNFHHLYYFYIIAKEGSVTGASQKLSISQSSLSMQLAKLEDTLGIKLFRRESKKIHLTEMGHHVLSYARQIFDTGQELADSLADRTIKGQIRLQIGVTSYVPKALVDALLKFLLARHRVYINLIERSMDTMIALLGDHKLDFVLSDLPHRSPAEYGFQNYLLAEIPVVLCASNSLARKIKHIPRDLRTIPMILPTALSQTYHALQEYFLLQNIKPNIIAEIQDLELVRRLVLDGKGIAPINKMTALKAPGNARLKILSRPEHFNVKDRIYMITKERKHPHPMTREIKTHFNVNIR